MLQNNSQNKFDHLEHDVRNGKRTDCPTVLYEYLSLGDQYACSQQLLSKKPTNGCITLY